MGCCQSGNDDDARKKRKEKFNKGRVRMGDPYDEIFEHAVTMN